MSAIDSLLRVMTLRDAEAIVLEAGKVPSLRRRGKVETMAMAALDATMLDEFAAPHLNGRSLDDGPLMVTIHVDGSAYVATIERMSSGLRLNVRRGGAATASAAPNAPPAPKALGTHPPASDVPQTTAVEPTRATPPVAPPPVRSSGSSIGSSTGSIAERITQLLAPAVAVARERGASDVFMSSGRPVHARIDGRVSELEVAIDDTELRACVEVFAQGGSGVSVDLGLEVAGVRVRVNAFDHLDGYALAARLLRERVASLAELSLPTELASIVEHRDGLVLVCGPTGSGKSTTLAALVDELDRRRSAHVVTLEDPIEARFTPRRCLVHQRELGTHIESFAAGLRAALREAPDVILLGELRDRETLAAALTAADTGHLVLATLHAPSAVGAVDRMIDAFPEGQQRQVRVQLAASLRAIVTQYLVPRRDGGRVAAIELVPVTPAVANIIRKGELHTLPTAIQSGRDAGMIPLERSLAKLVESGVVTRDAVKRIAIDHDLLSSLAAPARL